MKTLFAIVLFVAPLFAQDQAAAARAAAGCGPNEVKFSVKTDKEQHPMAQPEPAKAIVYVFGGEFFDLHGAVIGKDGVTTRWGVDGTWVGAGYRNFLFLFHCSSRRSSSVCGPAGVLEAICSAQFYCGSRQDILFPHQDPPF